MRSRHNGSYQTLDCVIPYARARLLHLTLYYARPIFSGERRVLVMRRTLLVAMLLALAVLGVKARDKNKVPAPPLPWTNDNKIEYQEVVPMEGMARDELYRRAKAWVVETYNSAQNVIQLDDPANGELIVKGLDKTPAYGPALLRCVRTIKHTLTIEVKDGRYRYTLADFRVIIPGGVGDSAALEVYAFLYPGNPRTPKSGVEYAHLPNAVSEMVESMLASLKAGMNKPSMAQDKSW